jgi:IS30 family transposase
MARNHWKGDATGICRGRPPVAGGYYARRAHRHAQLLHIKPRIARRLVPGNPLWQTVLQLLRQGLSPEQITSTLAHMLEPVRLSHETIYTALYPMPKGQLRSRVLTLLRRPHNSAGQRRPRYQTLHRRHDTERRAAQRNHRTARSRPLGGRPDQR